MPKLAESLETATVDRWLKKPGDYVEMYEPLCELITDKVSAELPSTARGVLVKVLAGDGETVNVGSAICLIETEEADAYAEIPGGALAAGLQPTEDAVRAAVREAGERPAASASAPAAAVAAGQEMRQRYSPAVLKLAAEHGIDLARLAGTGMGGRITRADVLAAASSGAASAAQPQGASAATPAAAPQTAQAPVSPAPTGAAGSAKPIEPMDPRVQVRSGGLHLSESPRIPTIEIEGHEVPGRGEYFIDVTPIRNTIATRMRQSVTEIPHAWTMIEVDVTNLVVLRSKLKDEFKRTEGINLTYMPFLVKAAVGAIKDYPIMNSVWATDKIIVKRDINMALAVGTEDSVITPVIKNADQKNIAGIAHEIDDLANRARHGKLKLEHLQGGTFTVNNTGSFGSILSQPIINYPQAAILTFESIVKRPVVINDMIGVRSMVNLCLSLDHRILDGVICGRFLQRVKENLESYSLDTKLY
ncbi:dihydrolipoamide acetyltransferase family protein [Cohnella hashimotonis]|uniref:Dihydrolipoamide acetyltransferase component of pyruvate dehydrogenase complex n=1 Tax=Cohnella hashimotonis TaxID=2826895 RepID=A0ABT6TGE0_9BACL|nr:dihydrolipoamide acetyltransferase family protein [Cohnella hashimotonis]MDI4645385.1 dihydrolipoamide acetyltransferase family protein [Cohnella hashimotonis]